MTEKITIIEGPTPEFREVSGLWIQGVAESPEQYDTYFAELRAFDGLSLVDRCSTAWGKNETIVLEYRTETGLVDEITIIAAHLEETDDGDLMWAARNGGGNNTIGLAPRFNYEIIAKTNSE